MAMANQAQVAAAEDCQSRDTMMEEVDEDGENDPIRMTLSPEERARALEVKAAVERTDHIHNLSDMCYTQAALTAGPESSLDQILELIYNLQCFCREYRLSDTNEEGAQLMRDLILSQPGYILSVDFSPKYGTFIFIFDFRAFDPSKIKTRDDMRVFMGGIFYIFKCLTTNFQAVREGVVFITECDGMGSKNFDWQLEQKFMHELMHNFPFRYKECLWLNTPTAANIAYSLLKPLVSKDFLSKWRIGCKLDGYDGRIDALFKMPTLEVAQELQIQRLARFLSHRMHNQATFRLVDSASPCHPGDGDMMLDQDQSATEGGDDSDL